MIEDIYSFRRELESRKNGSLSVTTVLRRAGLVRFFVSKERLQELAEEGRNVHLACADIARGDTPDYWKDIEWLLGYARGFLSFVKDYHFECEFAEKSVRHSMGYHGTFDLAGPIAHHRRKGPALIEVKRAAPSRVYRLQTAAYKEALMQERKEYKNARRLAVYLSADGTYKVERHDDPMDFSRFTAALTVARLRAELGVIREKDERDFDEALMDDVKAGDAQ